MKIDETYFDPALVVRLAAAAHAAGDTAAHAHLRRWLARLSLVRPSASLTRPSAARSMTEVDRSGESYRALHEGLALGEVPVTFAVLARDESATIARCLSSLPADAEILVLDTGSTDGTPALVHEQRPSARVVDVGWHGDFGRARNAVRDHLASGWVVFVDADEVVAPGHSERLVDLCGMLEAHPRRDAVAGALSILDSRVGHIRDVGRVFRLAGEVRYAGALHEQLVRDADGRVRPTLVVPLDALAFHDGYEEGDTQRKHDRNSAILTAALALEPDEPRLAFYAGRDGAGFGDADRAVEHYESAIRLAVAAGQPDLPEAEAALHHLMVDALAFLRPADAVAAYDRHASTLRVSPMTETLHAVARYNRAQDELRDAQGRLAAALQSSPAAASSHEAAPMFETLGLLAMVTGRFDLALRCSLVAGAAPDETVGLAALIAEASVAFGPRPGPAS